MAINVFISYSTEDAEKKNILKQLLKDHKFNPLVVEDNEDDGKYFSQKVIEYIRIAKYVIPIITKNSYQKSQWLNQEIGYAFCKIEQSNIIPIIDKELANELVEDKSLKLKGFIHGGQKELAFRFTESVDNISYSEQANLLIEKILNLHDIDGYTGVAYKKFLLTKRQPAEIPFQESLVDRLRFVIRIKLFSTVQRFRFYFKIKTVTGKDFMIGFTNAFDENSKQGDPYFETNEVGKILSIKPSENYKFELKIKDEFYELVKKYNTKHAGRQNIRLDGVKVLSIRFVGDYNLEDKIEYAYYFYHA